MDKGQGVELLIMESSLTSELRLDFGLASTAAWESKASWVTVGLEVCQITAHGSLQLQQEWTKAQP